MPLPPAVQERLARLAPDQRAAGTAPPGPVLCVAPAGSGKTTTLVARVAWLVATGTPPERICAVTFNKRAADELGGRVATALAPLGHAPDAVRVRTFHALGREILADAGRPVEPLVDRPALLQELEGPLSPAELRRLDDGFSRLKLDLAVDTARMAQEVAAAEGQGTPAGPTARAFLRYEAALRERGALDFDDLVRNALVELQARPSLLARWRDRCAQLLVDEVQDVDRSQLRLALLLAAPANRIFLVGDDDQT
ncbi:MAG: UvrD-helicase domain-containing protein [Candidatus Limnocylindrales bacterium]